MRVFIDTNVLLDVLVERKGFYNDAMRLWTLAESGQAEGLISAISFTNCYYIVRKFSGKPSADKALRLLRDVFTPVDLTGQILNQAVDANLSDFEDAIQYHSAVHAQAECIVSRDPDHFPRKLISVLSPSEFFAAHP